MQFIRRGDFSHVAAVLDDLAPGKRFLLRARPDVEFLSRTHGGCADSDRVPYPRAMVMHMQRIHRAARRRPGLGIDLAECLSIQRQLTWNRVIATVSGPLAAAYRQRTLSPAEPFSRIFESRHQVYYFAHDTELQGLPVEGYWLARDLHLLSGEPVLHVQPLPRQPERSRGARADGSQGFTLPILSTWAASVDAGAWEEARLEEGEARKSSIQAYKDLAAVWQPILALAYDVLTGAAGHAYEHATTQASFSQVGIRHVTLAMDQGAVSTKVVPGLPGWIPAVRPNA